MSATSSTPASFQAYLQSKNTQQQQPVSFNNGFVPSTTNAFYMTEGNSFTQPQQQHSSFAQCPYCNSNLNNSITATGSHWACRSCDIYCGNGDAPTLRVSNEDCLFNCGKKLAVLKSKKDEDYFSCLFCKKQDNNAGFQGMCKAGAPDKKKMEQRKLESDYKAQMMQTAVQNQQVLTAIHNEISTIKQFIMHVVSQQQSQQQ